MFDIDVHGTVIEAIANDLRATAYYLLDDRKDGDAEKVRKTVLHVTAARDMLNDVLDDIEEADETDYSGGIPTITITYADGSSVRITGQLDQSVLAEVAQYIRYESADNIPDEA